MCFLPEDAWTIGTMTENNNLIQPGGTPDRHRERLARISHHFLSECGEPGMAVHSSLYLVCIAPHTTELPAALAQALCRSGFPVVRLNHGSGGFRAEFRQAAAPDTTTLDLQTCIPGELPVVRESDRLLLFAETSPGGLEQAYLACKQLLAVQAPAVLGVTFCNCTGIPQARRAFERLAAAIQRFLGTALTSYGYLPCREDETAWERRLADLAGLLVSDWRQQRRRHKVRTPETGTGNGTENPAATPAAHRDPESG